MFDEWYNNFIEGFGVDAIPNDLEAIKEYCRKAYDAATDDAQKYKGEVFVDRLESIAAIYGYKVTQGYIEVRKSGVQIPHVSLNSKRNFGQKIYLDFPLAEKNDYTIKITVGTVSYGEMEVDEYLEFVNNVKDTQAFIHELMRMDFSLLPRVYTKF